MKQNLAHTRASKSIVSDSKLNDLDILKQFDLDNKFGPCYGKTKLQFIIKI
jgi:hypothetical protein